jgi:cell division protein FtsB
MKDICWSQFFSPQVLIFAVGLLVAGAATYASVTSDIAVLQAADVAQEKQNKERYEDLKEGQKSIEDLIRQLLLDQARDRDTT